MTGRLWAVALSALAACSPRSKPDASASSKDKPMIADAKPREVDSIGVATLNADGTLVLQLRAEGPGGLEGDALFEYRPTDRDYAEILAHVGPIAVGESRPVRPFPDDAGRKP
jgi:hypothetical protein